MFSSLITFLLVTTCLAVNKVTKVTWLPNLPSIITNQNSTMKASFVFPDSAIESTYHWLSPDNPGPRPDFIQVRLELAYKNGTALRPVFFTEMYAANVDFSAFDSAFILPSYILAPGVLRGEFCWKMTLVNKDALFSKPFESLSPPFQITAQSNDISPQLPDSAFLSAGDGRDDTFVSFYYMQKSRLVKQTFQGSTITTGSG
jgi:hypothetical protein